MKKLAWLCVLAGGVLALYRRLKHEVRPAWPCLTAHRDVLVFGGGEQEGRVFLRCTVCGRETPGWDLLASAAEPMS